MIEITNDGLFGSFLFFVASDDIDDAYTMSAAAKHIHAVSLSDDEIIDANELFDCNDASEKCCEYIAETMQIFDVDEDTAEDLLSENTHIFIDGDTSWRLQHLTALCARALGYRAVEVSDEQGTSYMIDMCGEKSTAIATQR